MYVINSELIPNEKKYKTKNKDVSDWLQKNGVPLLSIDNGFHIFIMNENLKNILIGLPLCLKIYA